MGQLGLVLEDVRHRQHVQDLLDHNGRGERWLELCVLQRNDFKRKLQYQQLLLLSLLLLPLSLRPLLLFCRHQLRRLVGQLGLVLQDVRHRHQVQDLLDHNGRGERRLELCVLQWNDFTHKLQH